MEKNKNLRRNLFIKSPTTNDIEDNKDNKDNKIQYTPENINEDSSLSNNNKITEHTNRIKRILQFGHMGPQSIIYWNIIYKKKKNSENL